MPVFLLKTIMPLSEYNKWLIFLQDDEPDVTELQLAVLSTLVSNAVGGKSKVTDFIIRKSTKTPTNRPKGVTEKEVRGAFGMFARKAE